MEQKEIEKQIEIKKEEINILVLQAIQENLRRN